MKTWKRIRTSSPHLPCSSSPYPHLFLQAEFDNITRTDIHTQLDTAVLDAYNWLPSTSSGTLSDEEILEHLLTLNLQRAAAQTQPKP